MDWARTIHIYREVLKGIIATFFDTLGLEEGETSVGIISRRLYRAVLRELQPAEAAVRRLIVLAARGLVVELKPAAKAKAKDASGEKKSTSKRKTTSRRLSFPLFDKRKHSASLGRGDEPDSGRRTFFFTRDAAAAASSTALPKGRIDSSRLCQRLQTLMRVLDDIPNQAKRLARLRARRAKVEHLKHLSPLRLGPPPGQRRKAKYEIDQVLREIHELAFDMLRLKPNTS